jgi:hypothetical protein
VTEEPEEQQENEAPASAPEGDVPQEEVPGGDRPPTEEELRAAYEAELKALRVKAGLLPGSEDEADAGQVALAVESVRRLLPLIEPALGENAPQIKDALSQLQVAYARLAGEEGEAAGEAAGPGAPAAEGQAPPPGAGESPGGEEPPKDGSSGLWVPGR